VPRAAKGEPRVSSINLSDIVKQFRKGIIIALSLVVVEHVAWIIEPTLFGNLIDATIDKLKGTPIRLICSPSHSGSRRFS